jgi:hypothetical protein
MYVCLFHEKKKNILTKIGQCQDNCIKYIIYKLSICGGGEDGVRESVLKKKKKIELSIKSYSCKLWGSGFSV